MPKRPLREPRSFDAAPPTATVPEAVQLERIRAGDEAAFAQVFKMHYRGLCDLTHSYVRSRDIAEELVQTVFLRVWERREQWEPTAGIRPYLFGACRNAALDHMKHRRVVARVTEVMSGRGEADHVAASPASPDETIEANELADAVRRAIQEMPERRRAAAILRWQHDLTYAEVARALGISVKGVEGHLSRAMTALRERLAQFRT